MPSRLLTARRGFCRPTVSGVFSGLLRLPFGVRKLAFLLLINLSNLFVNFREYILKIALTISIFQPKCTK